MGCNKINWKREFIVINAYMMKKKKTKKNSLTLHLKEKEKEKKKKMKPKVSRRKEITKNQSK